MNEKTILLIDDDRALREGLEGYLISCGYAVVTAESGEEGVDLALSRCPDLILLDVNLPGDDGFQTCAALKCDSKVAEVPLIMVTGLAGSANIVKGLNAGADDYLLKPFDIEVLGAKVTAALRRRSAVARKAETGDTSSSLTSRYKLQECIGVGATSTVYRALQIALDRTVAVKVLSGIKTADAEYLNRFLVEAKLAARLSHPNVVGAIDVLEDDGLYWLVMEYVEGESVQVMLDRTGALSEPRALTIAYGIALGLEHARKRGLIHRDVKPGNIIVDPEGVPKLADLGVAIAMSGSGAHTEAQSEFIVGTPCYISPEQIRCEPIDTRADVYGLGATLYHMLSNSPPFLGDTSQQLAQHAFASTPKLSEHNPKLSEAVTAIVTKAMSKRREDRYQTPAEMASAIKGVLEANGWFQP